MLATVPVCPFQDPEHLANAAERGVLDTEPAWRTALLGVKLNTAVDMASMINIIDDLDLARINAAINEALRSTICIYCDTNSQCHPQ